MSGAKIETKKKKKYSSPLSLKKIETYYRLVFRLMKTAEEEISEIPVVDETNVVEERYRY